MNIVICGATSRIAHCVARDYAAPRNRFLLVGRDEAKLKTIAEDLKVRGASEVAFLVQDLSDSQSAGKIIEWARSRFDQIDIVLVAQGLLGDQMADQKDFNGLVKVLETNYLAPAVLLAHFANVLEAQKKGRIAVITSVAGDRGRMSNYHYGSAKGGLSVFLSGLRNRLNHSGVSVTDLKLGFVDTPMTAQFKKGILWVSPEYVAPRIIRSIEKGKDTAYIPGFWRCIMCVIRNIPGPIFNRLRL